MVRASRRLWAVSMEVARVATSYNAAPGIVGERKAQIPGSNTEYLKEHGGRMYQQASPVVIQDKEL